jgi:hypothetical protein
MWMWSLASVFTYEGVGSWFTASAVDINVDSFVSVLFEFLLYKTSSVASSPQANYIDRAAAALFST